MVKLIFTYLLICLSLNTTISDNNFCFNNHNIRQCVDSIKGSINSKTSYKTVQPKIYGSSLKFSTTSGNLIIQNDTVSAYLNNVILDSIKTYKIENENKIIYAFSSFIKKRTGLMTEFYFWMIVLPDQNIAFDFFSLSDSPKMIYINDIEGDIIYFRFDYSDQFIHNKNYKNISFQIEKYAIDSLVEKNFIHSSVSDCDN